MLLPFGPLAPRLRHRRAEQILIAIGLIVGLVLAGGTWSIIASGRQQALESAERQLTSLAIVLAQETERGFQAGELLQTDLIRFLQQDGIGAAPDFWAWVASRTMNLDLTNRIVALPHISFVSVINHEGRILNISRSWPVPAIDLSDRPFFRELSRNPGYGLYINAPLKNRETGAWSIILSRAFTDSGGQFMGIVNVGMEIGSFEQFYSKIGLGTDGAVSLFLRNGTLLIRFPHVAAGLGSTYGGSASFQGLLDAADTRTVRRPSMFDGVPRLIVPRSIAHYPLIITASNAERAVLGDWQVERRWLLSACVLAESILAACVLLGVRQLRSEERHNAAKGAAIKAAADHAITRSALAVVESELALARAREQHQHEVAQQSARFDVAISNMVQGLIMTDTADRIVVMNQRFSELFGIDPSTFTPGMPNEELMQAVTGAGAVSVRDMAVLRGWLADVDGRAETDRFTWVHSNGRAFMVSHQPTRDGSLRTYEDITDRLQADARMAHMAHHDALTDLPNRILFRERLERGLAYGRRGSRLAVLCLDLDHFKTVNDTLGHPVGDALLQAVAQRLSQQTRETDTVARLGGDEFAIIQSMLARPSDATALAAKIIEALSEPFEVDGHQIAVTTSIGIALAPQDGEDADVLLKNADMALYRSKLDGRGVFRLFQAEMDAAMRARRTMEVALRRALTGNQFELHYQPLMDLSTRSVGGFEALLRWRHPELGLMSPDKFIALAEEIGAIIPIGRWVVQQACTTAAQWPGDLTVAVNLSPIQFKDRSLVDTIDAALRAANLAPDRLELEITETVMLEDTDESVGILHRLRALGVRIAMDDFGTGYSSLSYLRRFPFDRIKIDRSFVKELGRKPDCDAIIRAVIDLSHQLGIATTAEGVETCDQLRSLASTGCSNIQGYLFSPPVPGAAIDGLLRTLATVDEKLAEECSTTRHSARMLEHATAR